MIFSQLLMTLAIINSIGPHVSCLKDPSKFRPTMKELENSKNKLHQYYSNTRSSTPFSNRGLCGKLTDGPCFCDIQSTVNGTHFKDTHTPCPHVLTQDSQAALIDLTNKSITFPSYTNANVIYGCPQTGFDLMHAYLNFNISMQISTKNLLEIESGLSEGYSEILNSLPVFDKTAGCIYKNSINFHCNAKKDSVPMFYHGVLFTHKDEYGNTGITSDLKALFVKALFFPPLQSNHEFPRINQSEMDNILDTCFQSVFDRKTDVRLFFREHVLTLYNPKANEGMPWVSIECLVSGKTSPHAVSCQVRECIDEYVVDWAANETCYKKNFLHVGFSNEYLTQRPEDLEGLLHFAVCFLKSHMGINIFEAMAPVRKYHDDNLRKPVYLMTFMFFEPEEALAVEAHLVEDLTVLSSAMKYLLRYKYEGNIKKREVTMIYRSNESCYSSLHYQSLFGPSFLSPVIVNKNINHFICLCSVPFFPEEDGKCNVLKCPLVCYNEHKPKRYIRADLDKFKDCFKSD